MTTKAAAARRTLYWLLPSLVCLALYWPGLRAWFQADDFAWLSLHNQVTDFSSFLSAVFRPMAQGTVRPLSERLLFLGLWEVVGMDARPYRAIVFLTQFTNLILLSVIARKLTASAVSGFTTPVLWLFCPAVYLPMAWTSAYNQILCAFFLLAEFLLLMRYAETGQRRYYAGMWCAFLLGFGALELNVVFPALALLYTILFARHYVRAVLPLFAVSIAYTLWHRSLARPLVDNTYAMDFHPLRMAEALVKYIWYAVSAAPAAKTLALPKVWFDASAIAVLVAFGVLTAAMLWKRRWIGLLFLGWFLITLAPYLPLGNHVSDYYLTVPAIGLALLGGWGVSWALESGRPVQALAVLAALLFIVPGALQARTQTEWYSAQSRRIRDVLRGLATVHARNPDRAIVLQGADDDLFWNALADRPERALGWKPLYLTPETRPAITAVRTEDISEHFLPASVLVQAIRTGKAVVYDVSAGRVKNITSLYGRLRAQHADASELPVFIDAGNPLFAHLLKDGWYELGDGYRWTGKRAEVEMRGDNERPAKVTLQGRVAESHTVGQPLPVTIYVDGNPIGTQTIPQGASEFHLSYPIPAWAPSKPRLTVAMEVERTVSTAQDPRAYGLAMGTVAIVP